MGEIHLMKRAVLAVVLSFGCLLSQAQTQDPEFPKEFIMHVRAHSGLVTNFKGSAPDLFTGGLQLVPQLTVVENRIRMGVVAGAVYTNKKLGGLFGPTASLKLTNLSLKGFGTAGNLHLTIDHLWGTGKQKLTGGGIYADLLNKIVIGLDMHRDYNLNSWWLQGSLAFRISKVKKIQNP